MDNDASSAPVDGGVRVKNELATGSWLFFARSLSLLSQTLIKCVVEANNRRSLRRW